MIHEVYPDLFVGDGDSINGPLKALAGYEPGHLPSRCVDCEMRIWTPTEEHKYRCLDCALKHITEHWYIIHAAKEPWHRDALGYTTRGAPPDHPQYLVAHRPPNQTMLNLVDMPKLSPQYTNPIVEAAFEDIDTALADGRKVLIHCNEGKSRAPTIALLWLGQGDKMHELQAMPFDDAVEAFRKELYPEYQPGAGMEAYARQRWGYVEETTEASD